MNVLLRPLDAEGTIERLGFGRYRARQDSAGTSGSGQLTEGRDELALEDEIAWIRPVNHSGVMFATADGRVYFASDFQRIAALGPTLGRGPVALVMRRPGRYLEDGLPCETDSQ